MLQKTPPAEVRVPVETHPAPADSDDITAILKAGARPARRRWLWVAGAAVAIVLAGWFAFGRGSTSTAVQYTTSEVVRGDLVVSVAATGTVQPTNQVDISSELSGTIATVDVGYNDAVRQGQTLATLRTDKLASAVALSEATLTARQADVQQAEATVAETAAAQSRTAGLADKGLASRATEESATAAGARAEAALAVARANLEIARANLDIARSDLAKADIVSPIDGVVLNRAVEAGQVVAASQSAPVLFTLAENLASMELQVDIDEADVGKVSDGDAASFTVEAFGAREFPAAVSQVRLSPETVEGVVSYKAILAVDNADMTLRPGMTATAEITVDQVTGALLVPNAALRYAPPAAATTTQSSGTGLLGLILPSPPQNRRLGVTTVSNGPGARTIWVLRDDVPTAVSVVTGVTDGTRTEIVSGDLTETDKVITAMRAAS